MKRFLLALGLTAVTATPVPADPIAPPETPFSSGEFKDLARDLGHVMSFPTFDHANSYGLLGFDVGIGYRLSLLDADTPHWRATGGQEFMNMGFVRAVKGLPADIDVGLMYGHRIAEDEGVAGGELRWNFLGDGIVLPAIGARAAYTQTIGLEVATLHTASVQVHISKDLPFIIPFGGIGYTLTVGDPDSAAVAAKEVYAHMPHVWAGAKITPFPFLGITLQGQYAVDAPLTFGLQVSAGIGGED